MLTLITGTPRAGKTLLAVWQLAQAVPGSFVEVKGKAVPRRLLSNIEDLVVDHVHIEAKDLECWHTWAQPGDVIMFDEVQEVWRPRGLGVKVPPEIAALETHGHMGVDLVLITQHPMLIDPNIRRLVNQHLHVRRITKGAAMVYEWDHCENPGLTKTSIAHRMFFHRRKMYALYKSAVAHTKPKVRAPGLVWVALALVVGLAYFGPNAYQRITSRFSAHAAETVKTASAALVPGAAVAPLPVASAPVPGASAAVPAVFGASALGGRAYLGCGMRGLVCRCFDGAGRRVEVEVDVCLAEIPDGPAPDLSFLAMRSEVPQAVVSEAGDVEVLSFIRQQRRPAVPH